MNNRAVGQKLASHLHDHNSRKLVSLECGEGLIKVNSVNFHPRSNLSQMCPEMFTLVKQVGLRDPPVSLQNSYITVLILKAMLPMNT